MLRAVPTKKYDLGSGGGGISGGSMPALFVVSCSKICRVYFAFTQLDMLSVYFLVVFDDYLLDFEVLPYEDQKKEDKVSFDGIIV